MAIDREGSEPPEAPWWRRPVVLGAFAVILLLSALIGSLLAAAVSPGRDGSGSSSDGRAVNDPDGNEVVDPGDTAATSSSSNPTSSTATTTEPTPSAGSDRLLRAREVLGIPFGASMSTAEPQLTERLGAPNGNGHGDFEGAECRITVRDDLWLAYFRPYYCEGETPPDYELGAWLVTPGFDGWRTESGVGVGTEIGELRSLHPDAHLRDWDESPWTGWNPTYGIDGIDFELDAIGSRVESIGSPWIEFCPPYEIDFHTTPAENVVMRDFDVLAERHCQGTPPVALQARSIDDGDRHLVLVEGGHRVVYDVARETVEPINGPDDVLPADMTFCHHEVFLGTTHD